MDVPLENQPQIEYWSGRTGERWVSYQDALDRALEPLGLSAMGRAKIVSGERVLDIGCGCGATTLALSERVGERGHVTGVDVSAPMLARARARTAGVSNITLLEGDAATTELGTPADLIFSRLGVMFFLDPVRAFQHLRGAGKRLAFACWGPREENPWATIPAAAMAPFFPVEPPADPLAPGPFAFADRTRIARILADAGWTQIDIQPHALELNWSRSPEVAAAVDFFAHIGPASRPLAELPPAERARALVALGTALEPLVVPEGVVLPSSIHLVTATT